MADTPDRPDSPDRSDSPDRRGGDRRRNVVDARTPGTPGTPGSPGTPGTPGTPGDPATGLERRRGPGRRRSDFMKSADEGEMSPEQFLFIKAIDAFKRVNDRPFPTWTEVLEVIRKLGYRKTAASELQLDGAEDWAEPADAPAFPPPAADGEDDDAEDARAA